MKSSDEVLAGRLLWLSVIVCAGGFWLSGSAWSIVCAPLVFVGGCLVVGTVRAVREGADSAADGGLYSGPIEVSFSSKCANGGPVVNNGPHCDSERVSRMGAGGGVGDDSEFRVGVSVAFFDGDMDSVESATAAGDESTDDANADEAVDVLADDAELDDELVDEHDDDERVSFTQVELDALIAQVLEAEFARVFEQGVKVGAEAERARAALV